MDEPQAAGIRLPGSTATLSPVGLGTWAWGDRSTWGMNGYDSQLRLRDHPRRVRASVAAASRCSTPPRCTATARASASSADCCARTPPTATASSSPPSSCRSRGASPFATALMRVAPRLARAARLPWRAPLPDPRRRSACAPRAAVAAALAAASIGPGSSRRSACRTTRSARCAPSTRALAAARHPARDQSGRVLAAAHDARARAACCAPAASSASTLLAYSPLGMGRLTGKYSAAQPAARQAQLLRLPDGARSTRSSPSCAASGERHGGRTPSQVALNWIICKGAVPIPGAKNAAQAEQNAGALGWRLAARRGRGARPRRQGRPARPLQPRLAARIECRRNSCSTASTSICASRSVRTECCSSRSIGRR